MKTSCKLVSIGVDPFIWTLSAILRINCDEMSRELMPMSCALFDFDGHPKVDNLDEYLSRKC